jgi:hypothetical protein
MTYSNDECYSTEEELDAIFGTKEELAKKELEKQQYFADLEAAKAEKEAQIKARQEQLQKEASEDPDSIPF